MFYFILVNYSLVLFLQDNDNQDSTQQSSTFSIETVDGNYNSSCQTFLRLKEEYIILLTPLVLEP